MKRGAIFLTILLVASIAGTYAVYELYVKDRMRELLAHTEQKKRLVDKIGVLEKTFLKTEPQVVLDTWRQKTQPWSDAVDGRSRFYTLGTMAPKVEIPQEVLPKIYYKDELPKRIKKLEDYALDKQVEVADKACGVPAADSFGQGTNPKKEEIAKHLEAYDYCSGITMMLIDSKPVALQPLRIWPDEEIKVNTGKVMIRTTGITMQTKMQSLAKFFDMLSQQDRYFKIEELKLTNTDLQQPDPVLNAELVLSQAYFVPMKKAAAPNSASASSAANQRLNSVFSPTGGGRSMADEPEPSWWQEFRRTWLPF